MSQYPWERPGSVVVASVITGTVLHYDASRQPASNGSTVGTMIDWSGNGNHGVCTGAGITYSATGGPGSLPAFVFDGATWADVARPVIHAGAPAVQISAVVKFGTSLAGFPEVIQLGADHSTPGNALQFLAHSGGGIYAAGFGGEGRERWTADGTLVTGTWYLIQVLFAAAAWSASNPAFWKNGSSAASTQGTGTGSTTISPLKARIGANLQGSPSQILPNGSSIAELVVVVSADDAVRAAWATALKSKYGL